MAHTLELPEPVYDALVQAAQAQGWTPVEWLTHHLPSPPRREVTDEERRAANERLRQCTVSSGLPTGSDNEAIDRDLAREYSNNLGPRTE